MLTRDLQPRPCLWSAQMFIPAHAGQLFCSKEAAEAFEASGRQAILKHRADEDRSGEDPRHA